MFIAKLTKYDHYNTPKYAWEWLLPYIPKDKVIWEPFYSNGRSGEILTELGFNVIHKNIDFFKNNEGEIIISNPPFSNQKEIINRLMELDKPFILLMSAYKLNTKAIRDNFKNKQLQMIIPPKRIQYIKLNENMEEDKEQPNKCNFESVYYCYKMNLAKDIIFL